MGVKDNFDLNCFNFVKNNNEILKTEKSNTKNIYLNSI